MDIKKGDQVAILVGKDRGKSGVVLRTEPQSSRVVIEGLNLYKKRVRAKTAGGKGEMVSLPRPIPLSNVVVLCPTCKRPTRVGHSLLPGGKKMRLCKKCKATF